MPKFISPRNIEAIAADIRSNLDTSTTGAVEADVLRLADALNCDVEVVEFDQPDISAQVQRDQNDSDKFTIQISVLDSEQRQKFSIAHEIAHIVLHDDGTSSFTEKRQSIMNYKPEDMYKEIQANMLAAAVLMPPEQVKRLWLNSLSIDDISDVFNVSKDAAYYRLSNLGLLDG